MDDCVAACSTQEEEKDKCFELLNNQSQCIKFSREKPKKLAPILDIQDKLYSSMIRKASFHVNRRRSAIGSETQMLNITDGRGDNQKVISRNLSANGPATPARLGQLSRCQFSNMKPCDVLKLDEIAIAVEMLKVAYCVNLLTPLKASPTVSERCSLKRCWS
ncbi:hypothetical protein KIN20_002870 [Parelaphostrongylus tenuis]|uniref:Uncharacterized protein n=1 Tax=Parelaphostrongylus tenuis TaxID=148309 RepID=A0AAD5LWF3_PARTN|nr:hypothetical protein KIN20_002870 [Parelaphostrongylus tenuis]